MTRLGSLPKYHKSAVKVLTGSITLGTASITSYTASSTSEAVITRTGVGTYAITLNDTYNSALEFPGIMIQSTAAADLKAQIVSFTNGILTFRVVAVAAPTDPVSGSVIYYNIVLREAI
jgi:NaMN:DMB phosphoribosyltransferase